MNCLICVHENPLITYEWESTYSKRGYENLCVFIHPSLQELAGIHLILFWYPAQAAQIPIITGIVLWRLESSVNSTGQVRYFLRYSLDHLHPVAQLENILWDECLQKKKKGFREEREEGGREGWEGKRIQTWVKAGSHRIDLMVQLFHL